MIERLIVFVVFFLYELLVCFLLDMTKRFIYSKPLGRKLVRIKNKSLTIWIFLHFAKVTADMHVIQSTTAQVIVTTFSLGGFLRTLLGPMHFWVVAAWVQSFIWSFSFCIAILNVSSFLQVALITDLRFALIFSL